MSGMLWSNAYKGDLYMQSQRIEVKNLRVMQKSLMSSFIFRSHINHDGKEQMKIPMSYFVHAFQKMLIYLSTTISIEGNV